MVERSLIIEVEEKLYCFPYLWSDDMDIKTTESYKSKTTNQNSYLGSTDQKNCSF